MNKLIFTATIVTVMISGCHVDNDEAERGITLSDGLYCPTPLETETEEHREITHFTITVNGMDFVKTHRWVAFYKTRVTGSGISVPVINEDGKPVYTNSGKWVDREPEQGYRRIPVQGENLEMISFINPNTGDAEDYNIGTLQKHAHDWFTVNSVDYFMTENDECEPMDFE